MRTQTALVAGCIHFPFEDRRAVDCMAQVAEAVKPDRLVLVGDVADCWHWSRHKASWLEWPKRRLERDPESEIEYVRDSVADLSRRVGASHLEWVAGNHEDRVYRWYRDNAPGVLLWADTFAAKFGVASLGFNYHPFDFKFNGVGFLHGWFATSSRTNAKRTYERYGTDCVAAHVHRDEEFVVRHAGTGLHGCHLAGCLALTDPRWTSKPDWHQSFLILTFIGRQYHVERVRVIDGEAIYGGTRFCGRER
jgi:hypothetical protein